MNWDDDLEGPHLAIAASTARQIGVLAGPGTGKTGFGLMRRVARLVSEDVDPKRILLISFTRVAAADLRDKIDNLDVQGAGDVRATTLHSYCLSLLVRESVLEYTKRIPRILHAHEADLMLRDIGDAFGDIRERRRLLKAFEAGWARSVEDHPGLAALSEDRAFETEVLRWLREHRAMLIGEVVPLAYDYLRHNPAAPELQAYDHVIVDEYQDLNSLEQKLLDLLSEHSNLCVAGDDDQSIYSMRYANPSGIVDYVDRSDVEPHKIFSCGRCPKLVVDMANSLIKCAPARPVKDDLVSTQVEEGVVDVVQWDTLDEEIEGSIAAIALEIERETYSPGDVLVLTHRRLIGERIRNGLRELAIPVESYFTEEELDTWQAQEALAMFRLAVDPEDLPAVRVIVGIPDDTGRSASYRRVLAQARSMDVTPASVLAELDRGTKFDFRAPALVERYRAAIHRISQLDLEDLELLVDELFPDGVVELEGLRAVATAERESVTSAKELLDRVVTVITQDEVPQHPNFVRVMSLHKSKGLTSPRVYVVGLVEGVIPTHGNRGGEDLERAVDEQRRLLYVAVTRTGERLTLSSCLRMGFKVATAFGATVAERSIRSGAILTCGVIASRYLREFGPRAPQAIRGIAWLEGLTANEA